MKHRLLAALLALGMVGQPLGMALAGESPEMLATRDGEPWLLYGPMEGVLCEPVPAAVGEVPQGLEALYGWMAEAGEGSDAWLFRMPNGRVLLSASRSDVDADQSPQELARLWPLIARNLAKGAQYVNDGDDCVSIKTFLGEEWMYIRTKAVLDGEKMLSVELECYARGQDGAILEIWRAWPSDATYRYDDGAYAQTQADLKSAEEWLARLGLPER